MHSLTCRTGRAMHLNKVFSFIAFCRMKVRETEKESRRCSKIEKVTSAAQPLAHGGALSFLTSFVKGFLVQFELLMATTCLSSLASAW
ncbi:hypothetical protein DAPPUDRAFT_225583 [Daphnia pulex]|uniref:Uncharacterized protein n=1 Tax=Daphnia pulex TaxID=6669 RepID=E9GRX9_DAPPU|nr:hypothetical protein DAPPUDRAFT_225583 [Daphnia pulex]|eukprot:EFX77760.1 hypothetical protein DAPPUDRAFT_225583 [Daphnia pulex]